MPFQFSEFYQLEDALEILQNFKSKELTITLDKERKTIGFFKDDIRESEIEVSAYEDFEEFEAVLEEMNEKNLIEIEDVEEGDISTFEDSKSFKVKKIS